MRRLACPARVGNNVPQEMSRCAICPVPARVGNNVNPFHGKQTCSSVRVDVENNEPMSVRR